MRQRGQKAQRAVNGNKPGAPVIIKYRRQVMWIVFRGIVFPSELFAVISEKLHITSVVIIWCCCRLPSAQGSFYVLLHHDVSSVKIYLLFLFEDNNIALLPIVLYCIVLYRRGGHCCPMHCDLFRYIVLPRI